MVKQVTLVVIKYIELIVHLVLRSQPGDYRTDSRLGGMPSGVGVGPIDDATLIGEFGLVHLEINYDGGATRAHYVMEKHEHASIYISQNKT